MSDRPRVLIEDWLPIAQIGAESQRERGASSALPPLYFLHVWWARRPLTVSRAAILSSLLPTWSSSWPEGLRKQFPTPDGYRAWFLQLVGIFGDPVATRKALAIAKERRIKLGANPYRYKRAFTHNPSVAQLETLQALLEYTWGTAEPVLLDAFAGGGSIPFEALRFRLRTHANELNRVAFLILRGTLDYPFRFGPSLGTDIRRFGRLLSERLRAQLTPYFPCAPDEAIHAYLWARTVPCPYTGKPVPLSPHWWLSKGARPAAAIPRFAADAPEATFQIVTGAAACKRARPDAGTKKATGAKVICISPWANNQTFDGDYIKTQAQSGRLGLQLYAIATKTRDGLGFRQVTKADVSGAIKASEDLSSLLTTWQAKDSVPTEAIPYGHRINERDATVQYGVKSFRDFFSDRQFLSFGWAVQEFHQLRQTITEELEPERATAVTAYLAMIIDKALSYNSLQSRWDSGRGIRNAFERHDFAFKWSPAEFDSARSLFPWVTDQVADAYEQMARLIVSPQVDATVDGEGAARAVHLHNATALNLSSLEDKSVHVICIDPPYYNNVDYAELSDFFYVWLRRLVGDMMPGSEAAFTEKDEEAIVNPSRFRDGTLTPAKRKALARLDYERKMEGAFREARRVLRDDGVLTIMFTHKTVEAWDTLGASIINAGFTVRSSWPVHTESEHSQHQAKKSAAASTVLLACRKREVEAEAIWWDDLKSQVREIARQKAKEYEAMGIAGVDLYISTFGPVLSVISERWPVLTSEVDPKTKKPKPLRPEAALEIAREEVVSLRKRGLLLGREVLFDAVTDWYLLAWDAFRAEQFPADEARKLCLALDVDLEKTIVSSKRLLTKKGKNVTIQLPAARRKRGMVDPDVEAFDCVLDAVHTAMLIFEEDGARACERWVHQRQLDRDQRFTALLQAMANAIPVTKKKGEYIRPEIAILDRMNDALGLNITFPVEPAPDLKAIQSDFFMTERVAEEGAEYEVDGEDEALDEEDGDDE